ncbi:MAG: VOC family protein [Symploca sp. SIO1B1]|nr:VOC family protein [Symploca sp. SIO1C2]NER46405.1 VOC family protein [Symploca sp. SIO1A3]NER94076.1 VOC family protein [Symploca sp. SIO1B1]
MSNVSQQHGTFSWCELMTTDTEAAKSFYTQLLGWKLQDIHMEGTTYTTISAEEHEIGGMMSVSAPAVQGNPPPHWGVYVTVDDVDASVKKAEELGASILVSPVDIQDVGRFSVIQDPQGAVLSLITYTN